MVVQRHFLVTKMDLDGHFYDIPNNLLHNIFFSQRKRLKNGKLDNYLLGFSEYLMDVSRITQLADMDHENFHDFGCFELNQTSEESLPLLIS